MAQYNDKSISVNSAHLPWSPQGYIKNFEKTGDFLRHFIRAHCSFRPSFHDVFEQPAPKDSYYEDVSPPSGPLKVLPGKLQVRLPSRDEAIPAFDSIKELLKDLKGFQLSWDDPRSFTIHRNPNMYQNLSQILAHPGTATLLNGVPVFSHEDGTLHPIPFGEEETRPVSMRSLFNLWISKNQVTEADIWHYV